MRSSTRWSLALSLLCAVALAACGGDEADDDAAAAGQLPNPFMEDQSNLGKEDSQYQNPDGVEVEVDLEADVEGPAWRLPMAPAMVGQYAMTYLRKRGEFYLESLAEDATSKERVEWLVDGVWMTAAEVEAAGVAPEKLRHFRLRGVNAVLLRGAARQLEEGQVFTAEVPVRPFATMSEGGDACVDPDGHMTLSQSVYWYLWNPDRSACEIETQQMQVTLSRLLPRGGQTYPEYDQLVADGKVTAVVVFGQIGDGELTDSDSGVRGFKRMATWLEQAGFGEVADPPVGRRFSKQIGAVAYEIDLYSPYDFKGLSDHAHFDNFQRAISEHEIVTYDGHSMLGASDFWSRPTYPEFYQIYLYGGCLGYEYYVKPILDGKGGWDKVDIMSSVIEVSAGAIDFAGPVLAKIGFALENGHQVTWRDLLSAVRSRVGDSTFGVSGARENCYTPAGSRCGETPLPEAELRRFDDDEGLEIPDNDEQGVLRVIEVAEDFAYTGLELELEVDHSYPGDLRISLEHEGVETVVWDRVGGRADGVWETFTLSQFAGKPAGGLWTLRLVDAAAQDVGRLQRWSLIFAVPAPDAE